MKKFLIVTLAAAMTVCAAGAFAAEQAANDDASSAILSQVKASKETNKEKAGSDTAVKKEEKKPDQQKAAENTKNPAAEKVDAIVKYESQKAAKINAKEQQNKGTTAQPAATATAPKPAHTGQTQQKTAAPVKTVQIPAAQEQPAKSETAKPKTETTKPAAAKTQPQQPVRAETAKPAAQKEPVKQEAAKPAAVKTVTIPTTTEQPVKTQQPAKTEQPVKPAAPAVQKPAVQPATSQPAAPVQPAAASDAAEIPAGRPIKPSAMNAGAPETDKSFIVDVTWLKANNANVILIDARPESLYAGGHIPGAVNAPWTYFANMNAQQGSEKWGLIWAPATMSKRLGNLGVTGKKTVVAYDDAGGWGQSAYVVWILRQAGIKNAKILDGGIGAWKSGGGKIVRGKQGYKPAAFKITQYVSNYTATTDWINNNLGKPGLVIIDVRTEPEYLGKIRPFQEKRAGHLPGAINIPREAFMNSDSTVKSADEIKALLAQNGITPENEIVCYDTAGVRGAFVTMIMRLAEYNKSQNYDAGFQAWAGNPELPLVKP